MSAEMATDGQGGARRARIPTQHPLDTYRRDWALPGPGST